MSAFGIRAISVNPVTTYELGQRATGVRFTTQHPGGCAEFSCLIPAEFGEQLAIPPYVGYNYRVDVIDSNGYVWSGRMSYPALVRSLQGYAWRVNARCYGVSLSDQLSTTTNLQNTQTSDAIVTILTSLAPDIAATSITATGFTVSNTAAVNLARVTPAMLIAWAQRFGDSAYNPQTMTVYPDTDGTIRLTFGPRATSADVIGALSESESAEIGDEESDYANKVTVQYNSGASYVSVSDTTLSGQIGLVKEYAIVIPEISQSVDATQAANAVLTAKSKLRIAASGPLVYRAGASLTLAAGTLTPIHRVRSGQIFRFTDVDPYQSSASNLAFFNSFMIAQTSYDEDAQRLTITPESYLLYLQRSVATVYSLITGRHQIA